MSSIAFQEAFDKCIESTRRSIEKFLEETQPPTEPAFMVVDVRKNEKLRYKWKMFNAQWMKDPPTARTNGLTFKAANEYCMCRSGYIIASCIPDPKFVVVAWVGSYRTLRVMKMGEGGQGVYTQDVEQVFARNKNYVFDLETAIAESTAIQKLCDKNLYMIQVASLDMMWGFGRGCGVSDDLRRCGPKNRSHPSIGKQCPVCLKPFKVGDYTTLNEGVPADEKEAAKKAAGRFYTAACKEIHWECRDKQQETKP